MPMRGTRSVCACLMVWAVCALSVGAESSDLRARPLSPRDAKVDGTRFERLGTERTGIDFVYQPVPKFYAGVEAVHGAPMDGRPEELFRESS